MALVIVLKPACPMGAIPELPTRPCFAPAAPLRLGPISSRPPTPSHLRRHSIMGSLLSFRRLSIVLWLGILLAAGWAQFHGAAAQMYGNNGGYEGMRQTQTGRPTGAPDDEPRKQKSRPGEDVPLLA